MSSEAEFDVVRGRTVAVVLRSTYPSKLLTLHTVKRGGPSSGGKQELCWLFWMQFGGGAVSGDKLCLRLELKAHVTVLSATQGALKVYRHVAPSSIAPDPVHLEVTTQSDLHAIVRSGALLIHTPDAAMLYGGARFAQTAAITLESDGSLVLVDWLVAGRLARGESWSFASYRNEVCIKLASCGRGITSNSVLSLRDSSHVALRDVISLDNELGLDGRPTPADVMGNFEAIATVYVFGPRLASVSGEMEAVANSFCRGGSLTPFHAGFDHPSRASSNTASHRRLHSQRTGALVTTSRVARFQRLRAQLLKDRSELSPYSPEHTAALVIRIAATTSQALQDTLDDVLRPLEPLLGAHPYERRGIA